jgi:hypothetical protein
MTKKKALQPPSLTTSPEGQLPCPLDIPATAAMELPLNTINEHNVIVLKMSTRDSIRPTTLTTNKHQDGGRPFALRGLIPPSDRACRERNPTTDLQKS